MGFSIQKSKINPEKTIIVRFGREKVADVDLINKTYTTAMKLTDIQEINLFNFARKHGLNEKLKLQISQ